MFKVIQHNCARSYIWTMAALETAVEREADVECLHKPPRDRAGSRNSHPVYNIRKRKRVWTAVPKGSGLTTSERTDLSRKAGDDVIVVEIKMMTKNMIRIVNSYDQKQGRHERDQ
jgi:hypothetical protein